MNPGDQVAINIAGVTTRGRVAFADNGWIYWVEDSGQLHATREKHLVRII